ncbi:hypothetical protein CL621_01185 [archaeon]|nr:hypothetical protein [archaeon]|tara:strand:+ start:280 stop:480 length:201 start_codon:yes stop_codon:yes gene_type:complete
MKKLFTYMLVLLVCSISGLSMAVDDNETINEEPTKTERSPLIDVIIIVSFLLVIAYVLFGKKIIKT